MQLGDSPAAVAAGNAAEAALVDGLSVVPLRDLRQVAALGGPELAPFDRAELPVPSSNGAGPDPPDLAELRGQPYLRHALEVAAAGGHSTLIVGPPGAGKSLAARRLPTLLPPLRREEAIEVTRIASIPVAWLYKAKFRLSTRFPNPHQPV